MKLFKILALSCASSTLANRVRLAAHDSLTIADIIKTLTGDVNDFGEAINAWPDGTLSAELVASTFNDLVDAAAPQAAAFLASSAPSGEELNNTVIPTAIMYQKAINDTVSILVARKAQVEASNLCMVTRLGLIAVAAQQQALHDSSTPLLPPPLNAYESPAVAVFNMGVVQYTGDNCTNETSDDDDNETMPATSRGVVLTSGFALSAVVVALGLVLI